MRVAGADMIDRDTVSSNQVIDITCQSNFRELCETISKVSKNIWYNSCRVESIAL